MRSIVLLALLTAVAPTLAANPSRRDPVTPHASAEARQLLDYLYAVSGHRTLVGQHNQPLFENKLSIDTARRTRDRAAIYGQDFGYSARGTLDDITLRQRNIDLIIEEHRQGSIITLMWHAARPTDEEPVGWRESVQAELTEDEWRELVTPGTPLHERWKAQVDVIAWFLKQLQRERVPVIWRPYHEMNGGWFWWGDKRGPQGYQRLYRLLFERLVHFHGINNLIWCYNANELGAHNGDYALYYPGHDVVDVLATDVYRGNFDLADYERLLQVAEGRPIALGEVGPMPTEVVLAEQPRWVWFMTWSTFFYEQDAHVAQAVYGSERTLTRSEVDLTQREFSPLPKPSSGAAATGPGLSGSNRAAPLPEGFVTVTDHASTISVDLRYAGSNNFVGAPIDGYESARPILTLAAARALRQAQASLLAQGYSLKLFDAYRPQRAIDHFVRWARANDADDGGTAGPEAKRGRELFGEGYLAYESAHSRGSAVDVTLLRRHADGGWQPVDMGTDFDHFGPEAQYDHASLTAEQRAHRRRLREAMERHGFAPYHQEWWHFTLRDEPYPETYFNFPVR